MATNSFHPRKFEDFQIVDDQGRTVGHIRVKPSGVLWAPVNAKVWYGLSLEKFSQYAEKYGSKQKK